MTGPGITGVIASMAITLGVLAIAVYLLRRLQGGSGPAGSAVTIRVLKRVPVGHKQAIAVVQVAERVLVVSQAEGGMRLLTELSGEDRKAALEPATAPRSPAHAFRSRLPILRRLALVLALTLLPAIAPAQDAAAPPAVPAQGSTIDNGALTGIGTFPPPIDLRVGEGDGELRLTGTVGLVVFLGLLTLIPALLLLMTSFTRILIVLQFLRPALGTQTSPPTQLLVALAILLSGVVMQPVLHETNERALKPYFNGEITQADAYRVGVEPFREFMLANTRDKDLGLFTDLTGSSEAESFEEIPTLTIVSAFVISELRTAFQMGFALFLPFIILDVIVASVLMSLGMFMLPPVMVSLPFKLLLFVLADGWTLMVKNLVTSFRM